MNKQTTSLFCSLLLILFIGTFIVSCGTSTTTTSSPSDGQTLMQERCSVCHSTDRITSAHKTAAEWTTTVDLMVSKGAQLDSQEKQTLIDFLATNYK
jgi:hypothetical protein